MENEISAVAFDISQLGFPTGRRCLSTTFHGQAMSTSARLVVVDFGRVHYRQKSTVNVRET